MSLFHGVYPALVTPFDSHGDVDRTALRRLVAHQATKQADGFYVCGSTGQGIQQTVEERMLVAEDVQSEAPEGAKVVVHVGAVSVRDASTLSRHAQEIGAAAISSIVPPLYTTLESVIAYFRTVSEAAPELPLIPYILNTSINPLELVRALLPLPAIGGTKYTGPNVYELAEVVKEGANAKGDRWSVMAGMDEQCVYAAMAGAHGNIGSSVNLFAGAYKALWWSVYAGDYPAAMDIQSQLNEVITILASHGYPGALRGALEMIGLSCGSPRLPESSLTREDCRNLEKRLAKTRFSELTAL